MSWVGGIDVNEGECGVGDDHGVCKGECLDDFVGSGAMCPKGGGWF